MFDRGVNALLDRLPTLGELDPAAARRLLTGAFLEMLAVRDLGAELEKSNRASELRRLATALELHAVLAPEIDDETRRACAFVAAEALEIHRELSGGEVATPPESVGGVGATTYAAAEAAALYVIAGFDANAAVASRALQQPTVVADLPEERAVTYAIRVVRSFFELRRSTQPDPGEPPDELPLASQVRWELWRQIARCVSDQTAWLQLEQGAPADAADRLRTLSERLIDAQRHLDIALMARLLADAADAMRGRAVRSVGQETPGGPWDGYVAERVKQRPLLWPAARIFAREALPGPHASAVVTVPTGGGKSEVAEIAIAQALAEGWVLYLAPTNALVAQILRDLEARFAGTPDIRIRGFLGGAEYSELDGETLGNIEEPQVVVMTPEKCSLALRQSPDSFTSLRLLVMDECHLLGEPGSRGVLAELVISEVAYRAPNAPVVMLSALVANADELSDWLRQSTGRETVAIREPWRPTRTLRAVLGIDDLRVRAAADDTLPIFAQNPRRREVNFDAPVSVIANLQGAWKSVDPNDYMTIATDLTVPLTIRRENSGQLRPKPGGYVNAASGRLTAHLAARGHRVLTFLPKSRHYSFSVARDLEPLTPRPRANTPHGQIAAHLDLADFELGVESVLRELIDRGVAVHTSAMLRDEQRASEIAFSYGQAVALFATGTLAQGLNLPATAVVVGGTEVGHDPDVSLTVREERARSQLLNAIGRAGRAYVASRSLGIVIPDRWFLLGSDTAPTIPREGAPFLEHDDASTQVRSQIEPLIQGALTTGTLAVGALTEQEETAFAFLSLASDEASRNVVRRSFGAYRLGIGQDDQSSGQVATAVREAGSAFVTATGAPQWIREASNASGMNLPATAGLYRSATLQIAEGTPTSLAQWRQLLVASIAALDPRLCRLTLSARAFDATPIEPLFADDASDAQRSAAAEALDDLISAWMRGDPIADIAASTLEPAADMSARTQGRPLPKILSVIDQGIGFGVARAAGVLAAFGATSALRDVDGPWSLPDETRHILDLLPVAVRFGCDDLASVAWFRWGVRRRRLAHLLAEYFPPPAETRGDELRDWITTQRREFLNEDASAQQLTTELAQLVEALRLVQ
jgi:hypothetical protein